MKQELDVPLRAGDGRRRRGHGGQSYLTRCGRHLLDDARLHRGVANHAFADLSAARLELWFDQRDDVGARPQQRRHDGQDLAQRDERHVDREEIDRRRKIRRLKTARIEVFQDEDARVVAKRPVDLPVTDVERDDARRAAFEQDVGKAAGGGADIERLASLDGNAEGVERVRELDAAAPDVRMVRSDQSDLGGRVDRRAGFVCGRPSTLTWPARISARARSRDGARPRSTTSWSKRTRNFCNLESSRTPSLTRARPDSRL